MKVWPPPGQFGCLLFLWKAKTSNTMLNNSGKSGHPCLVPDLRGKALSFSPLRIILALGLSYMAFMILRYDPSIPTFFFFFFFIFFLKIYLFLGERERQSMNGRGAEREGDTESETGSRL